MGQVQTPSDLANITDTNEFMRFGSATIGEIVNVVNGGLEFEKNIKSQIIGVTFTATDTDQTVMHNLGYIPSGFFPVWKNASADLYNGSAAWTTTTITLRATSSIIGTKIVVF